MKYFLLFLLFHITCLALQPALNLIILGEIPQYCMDSCHSEEKHLCDSDDHQHADVDHDHHDHEDHEEDNGCVHACNPLMSCGCCSIVPVKNLFLSFTIDQLIIEENIVFLEKYPTSIANDFWHPPQLV